MLLMNTGTTQAKPDHITAVPHPPLKHAKVSCFSARYIITSMSGCFKHLIPEIVVHCPAQSLTGGEMARVCKPINEL